MTILSALFPRNAAARSPRRAPERLAAASAAAAFGLAAVYAITPPAHASSGSDYLGPSQTLSVASDAQAVPVARDDYGSTPGAETFARNGTNYDWAKLVLVFAGWPVTDSNVTVITRWMRQENGPNDWWNRNNPLNNGWGSGGGGGTGTYPNLVVAAQNAADALTRNAGYAGIRAGLSSSAPTATIEQAIWASPWASGHYANGGHWHYTPVPVVKAPPGAWGL